jgi:hypothetical protein
MAKGNNGDTIPFGSIASTANNDSTVPTSMSGSEAVTRSNDSIGTYRASIDPTGDTRASCPNGDIIAKGSYLPSFPTTVINGTAPNGSIRPIDSSGYKGMHIDIAIHSKSIASRSSSMDIRHLMLA